MGTPSAQRMMYRIVVSFVSNERDAIYVAICVPAGRERKKQAG